jgi:hypothetical protein
VFFYRGVFLARNKKRASSDAQMMIDTYGIQSTF